MTVSAKSVDVDYIWSGLSGNNESVSENSAVAYSYNLMPTGTRNQDYTEKIPDGIYSTFDG